MRDYVELAHVGGPDNIGNIKVSSYALPLPGQSRDIESSYKGPVVRIFRPENHELIFQNIRKRLDILILNFHWGVVDVGSQIPIFVRVVNFQILPGTPPISFTHNEISIIAEHRRLYGGVAGKVLDSLTNRIIGSYVSSRLRGNDGGIGRDHLEGPSLRPVLTLGVNCRNLPPVIARG